MAGKSRKNIFSAGNLGSSGQFPAGNFGITQFPAGNSWKKVIFRRKYGVFSPISGRKFRKKHNFRPEILEQLNFRPEIPKPSIVESPEMRKVAIFRRKFLEKHQFPAGNSRKKHISGRKFLEKNKFPTGNSGNFTYRRR